MTATASLTSNAGSPGVFWRPSAALRVATRSRPDRRLAAALSAVICAFTLLAAIAEPVSAAAASFPESAVAAKTGPAHAFVGPESAGSPATVGVQGSAGYDGVLGCCVAPNGLADDIIRRADANLTGGGETVLGHYGDDYIGLAQQRGASYFDIGDAWDGLSDAQRWAANQRVLDTAIANGDRITLATNRTRIRPGSALAAEIEYLTGPAGGYQWLDDVTLIPGG